MVSPLLQTWVYVELTMASLSDGSTSTFYLSNRAIVDDTNKGRYFPILRDIRGIGNKLDTYMPQSFTGAVILSNAPNTYGYERRLSDFLERYTPIDQTIKIYAAQTSIDDLDVTADFALYATSKVKSFSMNFQGAEPTITLNVASETLPRREITKLIETGQFPTAPSSSLGKYIPIVFGVAAEVQPIRTTADGVDPDFAYATTFGNTSNGYVNGGIYSYYVKYPDGVYRYTNSASAVGTAVYSQTDTGGTNYHDYLATGVEIATKITSGSGYILTQGRVEFEGSGSGAWSAFPTSPATSTGKIIFRIYDYDSTTGLPGDLLGEGIEYKSTWQTNFRGLITSRFYVDFEFTKPVLVGKSGSFFLAISQTNAAGEGTAQLATNASAADSYEKYEGTSYFGGQKGWFVRTAVANSQLIYDLYGVKMTDTTSPSAGQINADGLGHSYFSLTQKSALASHTNPDLSNIQFIVQVSGLKDDASGTVTGAAGTQIITANYAIKLLDRDWNGTTWNTGGYFDWTKFSAQQTAAFTSGNQLYREIVGSTSGRTFLPDLIAELARNSASRVAQFNGSSKQLSFYPWGSNITSSATISDEEGSLVEYQTHDSSGVINRLLINYSKSIIYANDSAGISSQGRADNYLGQLDRSATTDTLSALISTQSKTLYGTRVLANSNFDWINLFGLIALGYYYPAVYALPQHFVTIDVPFFKYSSLDMLDVVTIIHPDLPGYFGTSPNAKLPYYPTGGTPVDILQGYNFKRAKAYRGQIEGKEINWNLQTTGVPTMRLTLRLLLNNPADPT